ncbi:mandelate racemase/muconate lactonizing enzyme family protein [Pigmentiphaga soli]
MFALPDFPYPKPAELRIRVIEPYALDMPLAKSVQTPMGTIGSVVNLLVRVEDEDGVEGWGEIWCNFPRFSMPYRARLLREVVAPLLLRQAFRSPLEAWRMLTAKTRILRLQSGEPGPLAAVIAGVDIALWDIAGRKAGLPLWRMFGGLGGAVSVYASIGRSEDVPRRVEDCLRRGFRAFKIRSAGDIAEHLAAAMPVRRQIGDACELMLDLNSSWNVDAAVEAVGRLEAVHLAWLEEPIPADAPAHDWQRLAAAAPMDLAGGENLIGAGMFQAALADGALGVIQPDPTKWGGLSGTLPVALAAVGAGRRLCPHMFNGAPGVLACAHLLAACNTPHGILEYGVGHNGPREPAIREAVRDGSFLLGDAPGLGLSMDGEAMRALRVPL